MTQAQTLQVERDELLARAAELEQPIEGQPSENPQPACAFASAVAAATQLGFSADAMRRYLGWGQRERESLAKSLRNAALAYEDIDEDAAQIVSTASNSASPATAAQLVDEVPEPVTLTDTTIVAEDGDLDFTGLKQAAWEIEQPDQGASLLRFADEWTAFRQPLLDATFRFRRFACWKGPAAEAVEEEFERQASWLYEMADLCAKMADQARDVASAHRWAFPDPDDPYTINHPTSVDVEEVQRRWAEYQKSGHRSWTDTPWLYEMLVQLSEEVRGEYYKKVRSISPVRPQKPPTAAKIGPPADAEPNPDDELGLDLPDPTGMPSVPSMPSPGPTPDQAALTDALADLPGLSTGALKPTSFGGGGVGGGVPSMPLQPSLDAESASRPAAPARPAGVPGAIPGAGGGGMGMAPMGAPGAQGQGAKKGKRAQQEDKSLYTEKRPWTEPVVGRRRHKDAPE